MTDHELLARVAQNESWALAELYDRYARLVYSIALRMLRDNGLAEEVVQDVFTRAWRHAEEYSPERGMVSTWLASIARHRCLDELRRQRVRPQTQSVEEEPLIDLPGTDDPEEAAFDAIESARVHKALAQIPTEQRVTIELAYFEGMTEQEIATRTQTALGTVKTRIRLGMQKLKELLKG